VLHPEHPDTLCYMSNLARTLQDQGDLPGAREIQQQVLETSRRVMGEEHPDTIASAGSLHRTLTDMKEANAATQVFTEYLEPLLQKDPATLSANLRKLQSLLFQAGPPR
jgi:hypothetical protein